MTQRKKLLRAWRYIGPLLLIGIISLLVYLYLNTPLLIDPYEVMSGLESGTIKRSSLETMALLLPLMFILVCFLLIVLVLLMHAAISNEKKYLEILDEMHNRKDPSGRD